MNKYGLIGYNISYSKSPFIHQQIAKTYNRKIIYDLIDIKESEITKYLKLLSENKYSGFNVTIPYKESIIKYLDELTPRASKIGAVNTIYYKDNKLIGDNTDYYGFKILLESATNNFNQTFIVLGTGGASKAVCCVLKDLNIKHHIVSRTLKDGVITYQDIKNIKYDAIIQTTPVGSTQMLNKSVLASEYVKDKLLIDLIYEPKETLMMSYTKCAFNGYIMLIAQALKAQDIWFNTNSNIEKLLKEELF